MKAKFIKEFVKKNTAENVAVIFNDSSVMIGKRLRENNCDVLGKPNLWCLEKVNFDYIINGNEVASLSSISDIPSFIIRKSNKHGN